MSERLALAGRIRAALEDVQATINRAIMLAEKGHRTGDDDYWDGVALNLTNKARLNKKTCIQPGRSFLSHRFLFTGCRSLCIRLFDPLFMAGSRLSIIPSTPAPRLRRQSFSVLPCKPWKNRIIHARMDDSEIALHTGFLIPCVDPSFYTIGSLKEMVIVTDWMAMKMTVWLVKACHRNEGPVSSLG